MILQNKLFHELVKKNGNSRSKWEKTTEDHPSFFVSIKPLYKIPIYHVSSSEISILPAENFGRYVTSCLRLKNKDVFGQNVRIEFWSSGRGTGYPVFKVHTFYQNRIYANCVEDMMDYSLPENLWEI